MNEGVQGYARAALAGGIPCLLASKWDINARDSIHLMATTYIYMAVRREDAYSRHACGNKRHLNQGAFAWITGLAFSM